MPISGTTELREVEELLEQSPQGGAVPALAVTIYATPPPGHLSLLGALT